MTNQEKVIALFIARSHLVKRKINDQPIKKYQITCYQIWSSLYSLALVWWRKKVDRLEGKVNT